MTKRAPKHPKQARPQRKKMQFYVDPSTVTILDNLVKSLPELDNRSAAIRYLARWYDRAQGEDLAS